MIALLLAVWAAMAAAMAMGWLVQWRVGDGGWTDVFWTFSMGAIGPAAALTRIPGHATSPARQAAIAALFAAWALRLGWHILGRVRRGPEDARYAKLRQDWAPNAQKMMFAFLQLQALAGAALLASVAVAAHTPTPGLRARDLAGLAILAVAIAGEALADRQLRRFAADRGHRGQVCDQGLWSWSRHPNYFFQWLGWMAYPVIAVDFSSQYGWAWLTLTAPAYMYYLLRFVSGVPPLEAHMLASRGAAFAAYQARVSVFFPIPPRQTTSKELR
jgi:steroid 5-alpha reductase family enzyme